jgi:hypothetical protein
MGFSPLSFAFGEHCILFSKTGRRKKRGGKERQKRNLYGTR